MKFGSQFADRFSWHGPVQLHPSNPGCLCGVSNLFGLCVHKNSHHTNVRGQRFDNPPGSLWLDVTNTFRVEVETNHIHAEFSARCGVLNIRDSTDFYLHGSHRCQSPVEPAVDCRLSASATNWRRAVSGLSARISA